MPSCINEDIAELKNRLTLLELELAEIPAGPPGIQGPAGYSIFSSISEGLTSTEPNQIFLVYPRT